MNLKSLNLSETYYKGCKSCHFLIDYGDYLYVSVDVSANVGVVPAILTNGANIYSKMEIQFICFDLFIQASGLVFFCLYINRLVLYLYLYLYVPISICIHIHIHNYLILYKVLYPSL